MREGRKAKSFADLSKDDRKVLVKEAATIALREGLGYVDAATKAAIQLQLVHIQRWEQQAVKQAVWRVVKTMNELRSMEVDVHGGGDDGADGVDVAATGGEEGQGTNANNLPNSRIGKCGRKRKQLGMRVPGDKKRAAMEYKGAANHMEYRRAVKEAVYQASSNNGSGSSDGIAKEAIRSLHNQGI